MSVTSPDEVSQALSPGHTKPANERLHPCVVVADGNVVLLLGEPPGGGSRRGACCVKFACDAYVEKSAPADALAASPGDSGPGLRQAEASTLHPDVVRSDQPPQSEIQVLIRPDVGVKGIEGADEVRQRVRPTR
jgi:hypothetical protein